MKVHKQVGSKERFLEMFQGVNKIKLNEAYRDDQTEGNSGTFSVDKTGDDMDVVFGPENEMFGRHFVTFSTPDSQWNMDAIVTPEEYQKFLAGEQIRVTAVDKGNKTGMNGTLSMRGGSMGMNEDLIEISQESGNIDKEAFDELVRGNLNIEQTNTQASNGENYIEIVGADDAGNVATFKFLVTTTPGDQDGVATVDSAKLIHLGIQGHGYNTKSGEGVNTIVDLNNQRGQEMIEVVSEYVDTNDDMPDISEEMYEDAVKFIDKVPYNKGTEQIQTNKAYADQKPTNDALRVDSNQLDKFVSETDSDLEASGDLDLPPDFRMPKITNDDTDDGTKGIDPLDEPIDFDADEPVEAVSPEKTTMINQAYENLVASGNQAPTVDDILREVDKLGGVTKSVEKTRAIPRGAEEFYEGESEVTDINADDVVAHGYNQLLPEEQKVGIIKMADEVLSDKLGVKKFQMPKGDYLRMVKKFALEIYQRGVAHMNEGWETTTNDAGEPTGQDYRYDANDPEYHEQDDDRNQPDFNTGEWGVDNIKWKEVYDALLQNSQAYDAKQKPNPQHAETVLTDPEYGVISSPELEKLTHASYKTKWGIYDDEGQPYFDADSVDYPTFEEFVPVAKDIITNPKKYFSSPAINNPTGANFPSDMYEEEEKTYPDPIGKKFKPKRQFPKKKKKAQSVVKLNEEVPNINYEHGIQSFDWTPEEKAMFMELMDAKGFRYNMLGNDGNDPNDGVVIEKGAFDDPEIMALMDSMKRYDPFAMEEEEKSEVEKGNQVPGGVADDKDPVDFNAQQIMIGIGVEMEHTDDPKIALEIAMDHLMEIPDYYTRLGKMEAEAGVEGDETESEEPLIGGPQASDEPLSMGAIEPEANEGLVDSTPEEEETTDELLGFKPHNVGDYTNEMESFDDNMYREKEQQLADTDAEYQRQEKEKDESMNWFVVYSPSEDTYSLAREDEMDYPEVQNMKIHMGPTDVRTANVEYGEIMAGRAGDKQSGADNDYFDRAGEPMYEEEVDLTDYQGEIGDRYQDGKGNQLTVKDEVDGGVTLQGQEGDSEIATQDIKYLKPISEEAGEKFSVVEKTERGMTILFAFPDERGIETREGLDNWEMRDGANRELHFVNSREEAVNGLTAFNESKKLETVDEMFGINEEQVKKARRTLNKRSLNEGMTKKEAVQILIKHNIR